VIEQFRGAARSAISVSVLAGAMTATLLLGGCGKTSDGQGGQSSANGVAASAQPPADMVKLNAYTEAHNDLLGVAGVGLGGLADTAQRYDQADVAHASVQRLVTMYISSGGIEPALEKLKQARALPGGSPAVNKAADTLIADLDALLNRLRPLVIYYTSKAYIEDGLARGRAEDALLKAQFQTALTGLQGFSDALDVERDKSDAAALADLKSRGDMLGYDAKLALRQGESLVKLFKAPEDLNNPAVFAKGDAVVVELEKTLADLRQRYAAAKAKAKTPVEAPNPAYEGLADPLTRLIGDYRELKQSHQSRDFEAMTNDYNSAVNMMNLSQP
jgi:hypothetical protein